MHILGVLGTVAISLLVSLKKSSEEKYKEQTKMGNGVVVQLI